MSTNRYVGSYPVIGIRPTIDGRRGVLGVRESLEEQTMNITYTMQGDYNLPNLLPPQEPEVHLGKYALMRRRFLQQHRRVMYTNLLTSGKLNAHLMEIEQTAKTRMEQIISQTAKNEGVTEELKAADPMRWTGLMNSIRQSAEETVLQELIYS